MIPSVPVHVSNCPCGEPHEMAEDTYERYRVVTNDWPETVNVTVNDITWAVPRIYIACHGIRAWEISQLAGKYGFKLIPADEP